MIGVEAPLHEWQAVHAAVRKIRDCIYFGRGAYIVHSGEKSQECLEVLEDFLGRLRLALKEEATNVDD